MGRRILACALVGVSALTAACGERPEPRGPLSQSYPVTVQGAGDRPAVVRSRPQRVLALELGAAELVAALGAGGTIVGAPAGFQTPAARPVPVVSAAGRLNIDAAVELEPDLVLASPSTDQVDLGRLERATGAPVYVQPATSVDGVVRAAVELGFLFGVPVEARRLAGALRERVAAVQAQLADVTPVRVFVDTGFLITVPARSLLGDLLRRAGGTSVAGEAPGTDPFAPCEVARLEPEVVLVVVEREEEEPRPSDFRRCDPALSARLARVEHDLATVPGPRVPEALAAIARALHPDAIGG